MTERAVLFAETSSLVGVIAESQADGSARGPVVVFLNAGMVHRVGPNRLYVRLARELSRLGFASLRFDLSGIGDSPPRADGSSLHDAALKDAREALDFAAAEGLGSSFVLVGLCSGADLAFRVALADERVVGGILIDGFPYHTLRSRLHRRAQHLASQLRAGAWRRLLASDGPLRRRMRSGARAVLPEGAHRQRDVPPRHEAEAGLRALTERGVRLLVLSTPDRDYSYPRHFADTFPGIRSNRVEVAYLRDADHTFTLRANQDLLTRSITEWISWFQ